MTDSFFPFRLYSSDKGHSPTGFGETFQKDRPEFLTITETWGSFVHTRLEKFYYYCYDVIIHSQTEIEFICFDMYDNCYGGKGKEIHRFKANVEKNVTKDCIGRRLFNRGIDRRERELADQERKICQKYADQERAALGIKFKD